MTEVCKIEIVNTNAIDDNANQYHTECVQNVCAPKSTTTTAIYKTPQKIYNSVAGFLWDEALGTVPSFMKYFAFHESVVLLCGALFFIHSDSGVVFLSVFPGLSVIAIFIHFLLTSFDRSLLIVKSTFFSLKHRLIAVLIFVVGALSISCIYRANTYLSTLVPTELIPEQANSVELALYHFLQFPYNHSARKLSAADADANRPFNYRVSFVGSIIAPIIEESFKYLLVALTFPLTFIWSFRSQRNKHSTADYSVQSLFVIFIALCGAAGIAIMENLGYLAMCHWETTRTYCLPNKNMDILGAGLARGIFSVPFHCVTACIMADTLCAWLSMHTTHVHTALLKYVSSYPISIALPVFLHSSFNYWMKGIPAMTGICTMVGVAFLLLRISAKYECIHRQYSHLQLQQKKTDHQHDLDDHTPFLIV